MSQTPWYDADPRPARDWDQGLYRPDPPADPGSFNQPRRQREAPRRRAEDHGYEREPDDGGGWRDRDPASGYGHQQRAYGVGTRERAFEDQQRPTQPGPARPRRLGRSSGGLLGQMGALPGRYGVGVVIGSAALGALATVAGGGQPGIALALLIVAGTAVGGLIVRPRAGYLIIPVPALAYLAAALVGGAINAKAAGETRAEVAVGAVQWIAHGFIAMTSATILAFAIAGARWWLAARRDGPHG